MKDDTGREYNDDLTDFLEWYMNEGVLPFVPLNKSIHFVDGLTSTCIYRYEPFQVEFVTVAPDIYIPPHTHPNVDSYEVSLKGIEFYSHGKTTLPMWFADTPAKDSNASAAQHLRVRILPETEHSAKAGPDGGCFLSVQKWLNGVEPSAVGMDWKGGSCMGNNHDTQITSTEEIVK